MSLTQRIRGLAGDLDGRLRDHPMAVRGALAILGLALIAVLSAAAWTVVMDLRSESAAAAGARHAYVKRVQEKIQAATAQALAGARAREARAILRLRIEVDPEGLLTSARIDQSSGDPELDRLALAIVGSAAPFGAFPADMRRSTKVVELNSVFYFD